ncbi:hypothetical protein EV363DRAFT_412991 [Boletus edulis]|uniref:Uncharacterized protein n=1 Tax=Boletus edulis BED1 TaxID=1328754 RepID=A0AAD4GMA2_BOLED|nr:hypothetical protein EV363DRAFT_412991 [Boletus edulis]KAF8452496.1 hypothetical protein L210DRAFT_2038764 [Boletus edulis BED1]
MPGEALISKAFLFMGDIGYCTALLLSAASYRCLFHSIAKLDSSSFGVAIHRFALLVLSACIIIKTAVSPCYFILTMFASHPTSYLVEITGGNVNCMRSDPGSLG